MAVFEYFFFNLQNLEVQKSSLSLLSKIKKNEILQELGPRTEKQEILKAINQVLVTNDIPKTIILSLGEILRSVKGEFEIFMVQEE